MQVTNNLDGMLQAQMQINQSAQNIALISKTTENVQQQEVTPDLIEAITNQIPQTISYEANTKGIETQQAVSDVLLNIKA